MKTMMIDSETIGLALGSRVPAGLVFPALGLVGAGADAPYLTFVDEAKYFGKANEDDKVAGAFLRAEDAGRLRDGIIPLVVEDPRWAFYTLLNHMARMKPKFPTAVDSGAAIDPSAMVSPEGVRIGAGTIVEPRAVILSGTVIGANCLIRAGAVIGADGFEHKRTSKGVLSVLHDGEARIGDRVEIGVNNSVAKGFSYRHTVIGSDSKFDALVHFAHGAQCGRECFFAANAMIAGSVSIGEKVWVGPSVSVSNMVRIGDGAFLTMGSVVVGDVDAGGKVAGNFAMPQYAFIRHMRKISNPSKE
jgi:UDP-3-O-[3-hydroxymyristoyl] glucosamine N-acyltransferase